MVTSESAAPNSAASEPKRSATVLLLQDDPLQVLMVQRAGRGAFPSTMVFPGGVVEPGDGDENWREIFTDFDDFEPAEREFRIAAIREVWEETGILIGAKRSIPRRPGVTFAFATDALGVTLTLGSLTPFGHWITPAVEPRRFDTRFFLARMPENQTAIADSTETLSTDWLSPVLGVELALSGQAPIIFPTMANLALLAESESVSAAIEAASARTLNVIQPEITLLDDGRPRITIPSDSGYPITTWELPK